MNKQHLEVALPGGRQNRASRAARLPDFMGMSKGAPKRLDRLAACVVGCGAVGRRVALHLARLQPACLSLADPKRYKAESLLTQAILPSDVGRQKAASTAKVCKQISPATRVRYLADRMQAAGWGELARADLVVLATDNLLAEVAVGQVCFKLGIPLVTAAVHGETLVAQTKWLNHRSSDDPCLICQMGSAELRALNGQVQFSCEGAETSVASQPTLSVSSLCSFAADLAVNQILRSVLGLGRVVGNEMVQFCGYTNATVVSPLVRRPSCPEDHLVLRRVRTRRPLVELSFLEVMRLARLGRGASGVTLVAGELEWVQGANCACPLPQSVNRFVPPQVTVVGRCRRCRQALQRGSFSSHATVPAELLHPFARVPLGSLGAGSVPWLMVRRNGEGVWISTVEEEP